MNNFITPDIALLGHGVLPKEVTDVIITHADHDHIDGVHHFKNAVIHIQKDEYERGKRYIPSRFKVNVFDEEFSLDEFTKAIKTGGHQKGSCIVECVNEGKTYVMCGDEYYSHYNIENKIPTASTRCKENSQYFIDKYCNGDYKCLVSHETERIEN